jgi:hypothetical protein
VAGACTPAALEGLEEALGVAATVETAGVAEAAADVDVPLAAFITEAIAEVACAGAAAGWIEEALDASEVVAMAVCAVETDFAGTTSADRALPLDVRAAQAKTPAIALARRSFLGMAAAFITHPSYVVPFLKECPTRQGTG